MNRLLTRDAPLSRNGHDLERADATTSSPVSSEGDLALQTLYRQTPAMLHSIDQTGHLIDVSNTWLNVLGYERDEVVGRKSTEFLTEDSQRYAKEVVLPEFFRTGTCTDVPYQMIKKSGEIVDVLLSANAVRDKDGNIVRSLAVLTDVTEQKKGEERRRLSDDRFSRIFDSPLIGAAMYSSADKRFMAVNEKYCDLFGYSRDELMEMTWVDFTHPDEVESNLEIFAASISGNAPTSFTLDKRFVHKSGDVVTATIFVEHVFAPDGKPGYTIILVQDITERKQAEERRRVSEERFTHIFESPMIGAAIYSTQDKRIITVNEKFCETLGYDREEILEMTWLDYTHPEDLESSLERFENAMSRRTPSNYTIDKRCLHKSGDIINVTVFVEHVYKPDGTPDFTINLLQDVTERKRAEIANRQVLESIPTPIVVSDILDGCILFINPAARETYGLEVGMPVMDAYRNSPDRDRLVDILRRDGNVDGFETEIYATNGDIEWVLMSARMLNFEGRPSALVASHVITERKRAEKASREKSEFLSSMSHELRTPMNSILGYAQLLAADRIEPPSERHGPFIQQILDNGEVFMSLIDQLLDLSRIETGNLPVRVEQVSVADTLSNCVGMTRPLADEQNVTIYLDASDVVDLHCRADAKYLRQVILNLLSNAVKYNRDGGSVRLSTGSGDGVTRIVVTDTGPGINQNVAGKLFEPFERLGYESSNIQGSGIGLTISRKLVELMGGRIGYESDPGVGTTFWVDLPS